MTRFLDYDGAVARLEAIAEEGTSEEGHVEADKLLAQFVHDLGYTELANAYRAVGKWYA